MSKRLTKLLIMFIATTSFLSPLRLAAAGGNDVGEFRANLDKWVDARQILSKERSDWLVEKEYLRATRDLLAREKKALQTEIAEFEKSDQGASDERRQLLVERGEYQRTAASLVSEIGVLETQLLEAVPRLPEPLQKRLEPLLVQIPDDPEHTVVPVGQRLMNVLGVLAQAEKFNSTATLVGETRAVGSGQKVQVRTLYWGLGQAIYVDGQGETAGVARPGTKGWEFVDDPEIAREAKLLVDIYEGNVDTISFIPMPVTIR